MEIAICWTNQAIEDIYQIQEYLEHQSPNLASLFADKIFEKVELLKSFPYIGRIVPEFKRKYVRELIFKQYRIIYTIATPNRIDIIAVSHSSQNHAKLSLFG